MRAFAPITASSSALAASSFSFVRSSLQGGSNEHRGTGLCGAEGAADKLVHGQQLHGP